MKIFNKEPSKSLLSIYENGGYRNENFRGSKHDDPVDVILFEIEELGNYHIKDEICYSILEYCKSLYTGDKTESHDPISDRIHSQYLMEIITQLKDLPTKDFVENVIFRLTKNRRKDFFVKWLTTKEIASELYSYGDGYDEITCYPIKKDKSICLCDLGTDGCLFLLERKHYNEPKLVAVKGA